jgi:tetratricopeptide (TPR) repeat protein
MLFGRSEATNGKYAEAYAIFDSGLEVAPFRTHKGEFLMQKGSAKCTQAASGTAEARASLTSEGGALFEKAIAELEQARGEDAERAAIPGGLATITEALARAHYGRGRCRAAIGEISEAEAEFKTAVELVGAESVLGKKIQAVIASLAAVKR